MAISAQELQELISPKEMVFTAYQLVDGDDEINAPWYEALISKSYYIVARELPGRIVARSMSDRQFEFHRQVINVAGMQDWRGPLLFVCPITVSQFCDEINANQPNDEFGIYTVRWDGYTLTFLNGKQEVIVSQCWESYQLLDVPAEGGT